MEPTTIALALAALSAGANYVAQKKVDSATSKAMRQNQKRLTEEQDKAALAASRTEDAYSGMPAKQEAAGDELASAFKDVTPSVQESLQPSYIRPGQSTDQQVLASEAATRTGTKRYTDQLAEALGQMRGVDQANLGAGLTARDNATDISRAGVNMRGANSVLQGNLAAAQQKGQGWGTIGDLASMAAMVYAPYALSSASGAAAATPTAEALVGGGATASGGIAPGVLAQGEKLWAQMNNFGRKLPINLRPPPKIPPLNIPGL